MCTIKLALVIIQALYENWDSFTQAIEGVVLSCARREVSSQRGQGVLIIDKKSMKLFGQT